MHFSSDIKRENHNCQKFGQILNLVIIIGTSVQRTKVKFALHLFTLGYNVEVKFFLQKWSTYFPQNIFKITRL